MLNLNPEEIQDIETLIPDGDYNCVVFYTKNDDDVESNSGAIYDRVTIGLEIVDGDYSGERFFERVIYSHSKNQNFAKRGLSLLKKIHTAAGCEGPITEESLRTGGPFCVTIGTEEGSNGYPDRNTIKAVSVYAAENPVTTTAPPAATSW